MALRSLRALAVGGVLAATLAGCADKPVVLEMSRPVSAAQDPAKVLTVVNAMELCDSPVKIRCMQVAAGTYALEAEDGSYLYFRAPEPIRFRQVNPDVTNESKIPGGLMLGKSTFSPTPAGAYILGSGLGEKVWVWRLGPDFMAREGTDWKKSF